MKDKDLIYMYAVQEKVEKLGDGYQVITYRMLELGPNVTPDVSVMKQSEGRRASACPIDNWVGFQCGTIV